MSILKEFTHFWVKCDDGVVVYMMILAVVDSAFELVDNRNRPTCDDQGFCSPHITTWDTVILLVLDNSRNSFGYLRRADYHDVF